MVRFCQHSPDTSDRYMKREQVDNTSMLHMLNATIYDAGRVINALLLLRTMSINAAHIFGINSSSILSLTVLHLIEKILYIGRTT